MHGGNMNGELHPQGDLGGQTFLRIRKPTLCNLFEKARFEAFSQASLRHCALAQQSLLAN